MREETMKTTVKVYTFTAVLLISLSLSVQSDTSVELLCRVDGTDDIFKIYPSQLIFLGKKIMIYQLIDGLTVFIVNTQTGRFNRLSNLNLMPQSTLDPRLPPEPPQFFSGHCDL